MVSVGEVVSVSNVVSGRLLVSGAGGVVSTGTSEEVSVGSAGVLVGLGVVGGEGGVETGVGEGVLGGLGEEVAS